LAITTLARTILRIAQEEKKRGNDLGIVNGDKVIARFVGI
jgi:hypothetical protein